MKLLIVIPAYNEENNISYVVNNLKENYPYYDYVVVNDGSKDNTAKICLQHNYELIDLPINLGLAGGIQTGFKYAYENGYDAALQFDGDGQHLPEYIDKMLQQINKYDIVIGSRYIEEKKTKSLRMLGSNIIQFIIKLTTGVTIHDPTSGMRMVNRSMLKEFAYNMNYGPEPDTISYLIKKKQAKIKEVQVKMAERTYGESYLNLKTSIFYMLRMCTSIIFIQCFRRK